MEYSHDNNLTLNKLNCVSFLKCTNLKIITWTKWMRRKTYHSISNWCLKNWINFLAYPLEFRILFAWSTFMMLCQMANKSWCTFHAHTWETHLTEILWTKTYMKLSLNFSKMSSIKSETSHLYIHYFSELQNLPSTRSTNIGF